MPTSNPSAKQDFDKTEIARASKELSADRRIEWYLGRTGTSKFDLSDNTADQIARRVDLALTALQVDPARWSEYYTRTTTPPWEDDTAALEADKNFLKRRPMRLGRYLLERAAWELPIEFDEVGESSVDIELTLKNGRVALFNAEGNYWTEYVYQTISAEDMRSIDELTEANIEPDQVSAEYSIEARLWLMPRN